MRARPLAVARRGARFKIPLYVAFVREGEGIHHSGVPVGRLMRLIARCCQTRETRPRASARATLSVVPSRLASRAAEEFASRCQRPAHSKVKSNFRASEVLRELKRESKRERERGNSCRFRCRIAEVSASDLMVKRPR